MQKQQNELYCKINNSKWVDNETFCVIIELFQKN